ncbi:hypothetical protein HMI54_012543 [Coelomomyces lativittatus]|nr:hypothetical protein HMI54_012543 [Coelomomyces lativittatus]KAJ1500791.1 hypothetical protein HMI55_003730 [Coelomomyces lativittatus]
MHLALHFHRWTTLSDHAFLHLPPQLEFTHLHTLSLVDPGGMYTAVGSQGLKVMIQACPNLHHLHLWCNLRVDGNTLLQCVSQCTLTSLSLSSSQWISDQEWINVFAQTPMLKYLNVSHVIQCTDPWFQSFPKSLEVVGIHGGSQLTDAGVFHWRDRCPKLSTVKFWDCPKISLGVMEKLGFTSVHYTPAILHPPCFKVGIGFGFQRHVSHPLSPSFSLSPPLRPSPITPSSTSSLQSKVEETEASPSSTLPASSTTHAASSDSVGQEENISSTSEDEVESEVTW